MSCNKVSYSSIKEAKTAIHNMKNCRQLKIHKLKAKSRPYSCFHCDSYHLTTMSSAESKRQKKKLREKKRRLDIVTKIKENKSIDKIFELSEDWMTLIFKGSKWVLECEIFEYIYCVKGQEV